MEKAYLKGIKIIKIYVVPPNVNVLKSRINKDNRDPSGERYLLAIKELKKVSIGTHSKGMRIFVNEEGISTSAKKLHFMIKKLKEK